MTLPVGALVRDLSLPALGYGRVVERRGKGAVGVLFQTEPTPREVRPGEQREVVRAKLHAGQRVQVTDPASAAARDGAVVRVVEPPPKKKVRPEDEEESDGLVRYEVEVGGQTAVLAEDRVMPQQAATDDPLDRVEALSWDEPAAFFSRAAMHQVASRWYEESFGIPALLGARIEFLPHQVHAARRVLCDRAPRYVLADEVGLGKTIEAGLVAQALAAARPDLRVLVIAPGSMSRQWLCELFLRFGEQVFVHLDVTRLSTEEQGELPARARVIVSTTALEAFPELRQALLAQRWDLVIVDEAHQVPPDRPLYAFLREAAERAPGVLLLSATPGKRDEVGLLGLLALVAPDAYGKAGREALAKRLAAQEAISAPLAEAAALVDAGAALDEAALRKVAARWKGALPHDPIVEGLRARLIDGDEDALGELVAYVQEFHRLDRRIVRTRRATVRALGTALCERTLQVVRYKPHEAEASFVAHVEALPDAADLDQVQRGLRGLYLRAASTTPVVVLTLLEARRKVVEARKKKKGAAPAPFDLLAALTSDPGPSDEERLRERAIAEARPLPGEAEWLQKAIDLVRAWMVQDQGAAGGCARFRAAIRWVKEHLGGGAGKVLVFSQEREVVDELATALTEELGEGSVATFHHGLEDAHLSEAALRFQQPGDCKVLVSDELGGEGRNFQVASAVVHLDQPWSPARVEQRVGRLDRIGRDPKRPVLSVVLSGPSRVEKALLKLHGEVLKVYERSLGGLELLMPRVQGDVADAACRGAAALEALARPVAAAVEQERARQDEAWERALDASKRSLDEAAEHADVLAATEGERDAAALQAWARRLNIGLKPLGDDVWSAAWSWEHLRRVPAGLAPPGAVPTEGRARRRGTFSRKKALEDESLELFAPGHPLIDALARDALGPTDGRAAVMLRKLGGAARGRAFAIVLGRTALDRAAWGQEDVPAGLVYRAQARLWPQTRPVVVELHPGKRPGATVLADKALAARLLAPPGDPDDPEVDPEARDEVVSLDRDALARAVHLPHLVDALRAGVEVGLGSLREARRREAEGAARDLLDDFKDDLGYLRGVAAREQGPARDEALREVALRERLVESVQREQVLLDALAVVLGA